MEFKHVSVLREEAVDGLKIRPDGIYVDGTMGGAGHSLRILSQLEGGRLIGIDQDRTAIDVCRERLAAYPNATLVHDNFRNIRSVFQTLQLEKASGFLLDLGVSSKQLDDASRGFSYMQDAPLDMRMNTNASLDAATVVNEYSQDELRRILTEYGEERWASRIAEFIVSERRQHRINTTMELVHVIKAAVPKGAREDGPHPAKRSFQAIRIEVNQELTILENAIRDMVDLLEEGGRISIITFHSLEDRIVKQTFASLEHPCTCPKSFPVCVCGKKPQVRVITRKPILPSAEEIEANPRSRSAKLRVAEKIL